MALDVLIAVAGTEPADYWAAVRPLLPPDASVTLVHVVDAGPREEMELAARFRPGHPHPPDIATRADRAEVEGAQRILEKAARELGGSPTRLIARGRPEQVIVVRAHEMNVGLLAVGARWDFSGRTPGPHSIGHVARFVIDHSPCPVLVVRQPGQ